MPKEAWKFSNAVKFSLVSKIIIPYKRVIKLPLLKLIRL